MEQVFQGHFASTLEDRIFVYNCSAGKKFFAAPKNLHEKGSKLFMQTIRGKQFAAGIFLLGLALILWSCSGATTSPPADSPTAPSFTLQPASQTVMIGQPATFSVTAAGTAPLTYQWQKNNANISGATSANYITPATVSGDNGATFRVIASNSVGNVTSNVATLTVNAAPVAPSISTQPANQTVTVGQTATFSVIAAGTAPL